MNKEYDLPFQLTLESKSVSVHLRNCLMKEVELCSEPK